MSSRCPCRSSECQSDASEEHAACALNTDNKRTSGGFGAIPHSRVAGGSPGVQGDAAMALPFVVCFHQEGGTYKAGAVPIFLHVL